ncbi:HIRAN domain-containing protein [Yoonia sp.]|uniref:HIRAN domain-containing protein n=1 Tax=Yoonia sp. TaxID=2212373 RepID=UPI0039198E66
MNTLSRRGFVAGAGVAVAAAAPAGAAAGPVAAKAVPVLQTHVTGTTPGMIARAGRQLSIGSSLALVREPDNDYDPRAVAVWTADGAKVGYVPRVANQTLQNLMDAGFAFTAQLTSLQPGGPRPDIKIAISLVSA